MPWGFRLLFAAFLLANTAAAAYWPWSAPLGWALNVAITTPYYWLVERPNDTGDWRGHVAMALVPWLSAVVYGGIVIAGVTYIAFDRLRGGGG